MSEIPQDSRDTILQRRITLLEAYIHYHPKDRTGIAELDKYNRQLDAIYAERRAALSKSARLDPRQNKDIIKLRYGSQKEKIKQRKSATKPLVMSGRRLGV